MEKKFGSRIKLTFRALLKDPNYVWAADFETPADSIAFLFFSDRFGRNKQKIKFAHWHIKVFSSKISH
jgi:hypothetical protein